MKRNGKMATSQTAERSPSECCPLQLNMSMASEKQLKNQSQLLTVEELGAYLKISKSSVYRMIERRLIPFFKIRSGLRFDIVDVEKYLLSCRTEAMNDENVYGGLKI